MNRMILRLVVLVACMGLGVAFAEDKPMTSEQKDECLLISKDCRNASLTIQEKIKKLQDEIAKGEKVYTPAELKKLEDKLKEAENLLDNILSGP